MTSNVSIGLQKSTNPQSTSNLGNTAAAKPLASKVQANAQQHFSKPAAQLTELRRRRPFAQEESRKDQKHEPKASAAPNTATASASAPTMRRSSSFSSTPPRIHRLDRRNSHSEGSIKANEIPAKDVEKARREWGVENIAFWCSKQQYKQIVACPKEIRDHYVELNGKKSTASWHRCYFFTFLALKVLYKVFNPLKNFEAYLEKANIFMDDFPTLTGYFLTEANANSLVNVGAEREAQRQKLQEEYEHLGKAVLSSYVMRDVADSNEREHMDPHSTKTPAICLKEDIITKAEAINKYWANVVKALQEKPLSLSAEAAERTAYPLKNAVEIIVVGGNLNALPETTMTKCYQAMLNKLKRDQDKERKAFQEATEKDAKLKAKELKAKAEYDENQRLLKQLSDLGTDLTKLKTQLEMLQKVDITTKLTEINQQLISLQKEAGAKESCKELSGHIDQLKQSAQTASEKSNKDALILNEKMRELQAAKEKLAHDLSTLASNQDTNGSQLFSHVQALEAASKTIESNLEVYNKALKSRASKLELELTSLKNVNDKLAKTQAQLILPKLNEVLDQVAEVQKEPIAHRLFKRNESRLDTLDALTNELGESIAKLKQLQAQMGRDIVEQSSNLQTVTAIAKKALEQTQSQHKENEEEIGRLQKQIVEVKKKLAEEAAGQEENVKMQAASLNKRIEELKMANVKLEETIKTQSIEFGKDKAYIESRIKYQSDVQDMLVRMTAGLSESTKSFFRMQEESNENLKRHSKDLESIRNLVQSPSASSSAASTPTGGCGSRICLSPNKPRVNGFSFRSNSPVKAKK